MIKAVLAAFFILFAVSGICEMLHDIRLAFISLGRNKGTYSLVWLKPGRAVKQLRFVSEQMRWHGERYAGYIIALTCEIDADELSDCAKAAENEPIILCPAEALENVVKSIN